MASTEKPLSKAAIFGTSGLGGVAGWVVVHPFNTMAVRMNLASMTAAPGTPTPSFGSFASQLVKSEGFMSLYAGLGAGCLRQVFYATSRYGLFETFRDAAAKFRKTDFAQRFTLASVAGGCAAVISCPVEVCLVRMSNDASLPADQRRGYTSVMNACVRIAKEDGLGAFYRGVQPFAMRAMLVGGTQVATYDQFKEMYGSLGLKGLVNQFASSMSAGLIYSIVTMPFETAKNRMAFQKPDPVTKEMPYRGTLQTIGAVARADGALSLWTGFLPYYSRCGGHTVTMFIFVDQIRIFYRKFL